MLARILYASVLLVSAINAAVPSNDGSGFIASILSPNASTVWSTGDTVIVRWMSNNTAPDIYPKEGLSIGLYLERRGFDKAIKGATAWYNNFLQGVNEVELKIPRYAISNTSDHFYVRFFKKRAIGDHIYAESAPFAVVNSEQNEYRDDDDDFIDYIVSPKAGDTVRVNDTINIQFRTMMPIPPRRRVYCCLSLVRKNWFDKECIEKITIEGPFAGTVSVPWIIPSYLPPSRNYVFKFYRSAFMHRHKMFTSSPFEILSDAATGAVPINGGNTTAQTAEPIILQPPIGNNSSQPDNSVSVPKINITEILVSVE